MAKPRVWIRYRPRLYHELLTRIFQSLEPVEVVESYYQDSSCGESERDRKAVDVIILSLNRSGKPEVEMLPNPVPDAKLVAFSPSGTTGFRRLPGAKQWEKFQPFGLDHLLKEVVQE